jgi:hypothetical protein
MHAHAHTHTHTYTLTCSTSGIDDNCAKSFDQETLENIGIDEVNIKMDVGGCDWAQLWSLVRMVMNIVVSYNVVNLLAS